MAETASKTVDLNIPGSMERTIALTEIQAVLNRYAITARNGVAWEKLALVFHPDGLFRLPNGVVVAPADMSKVAQGEEPGIMRHHLTSSDVHFVSSHEARVEAYYFAITDSAAMDHWGRWVDVFTRSGDDGPWLIAERTIVVEGSDPRGWYAAKYGGSHHAAGGKTTASST